MTLNQLTYFMIVAKYENYHQAAEELYISQPSLSRSIAALEEELGVMLFEKVGRGIVLTKAGHVFIEYAKSIVDESEIAIGKMKALGHEGGVIDIAYVFPLANYYMPHKVRKFLSYDNNEDTTINFFQGNTAQIIERIKKGQTDVGFGGYVDGEDELEFFPILNNEIVIIVPKDHELADKKEVSVDVLLDYPVVGYDRTSGLGMYTKAVYRRLNMNPDIAFECPDENSIQSLVIEHFGIALVPNIDILNKEKLSILNISDASLASPIFMIWKKGRYQLPAVTKFIDFMMQEVGNDD